MMASAIDHSAIVLTKRRMKVERAVAGLAGAFSSVADIRVILRPSAILSTDNPMLDGDFNGAVAVGAEIRPLALKGPEPVLRPPNKFGGRSGAEIIWNP